MYPFQSADMELWNPNIFRTFCIWQPILRSLGTLIHDLELYKGKSQIRVKTAPLPILETCSEQFSTFNDESKENERTPSELCHKFVLHCQDTTTATKPECMVCQKKIWVDHHQKQVLCLCDTRMILGATLRRVGSVILHPLFKIRSLIIEAEVVIPAYLKHNTVNVL